MPKKQSLNHQMHHRMEKMKCIGESKHQAKQEYRKYCEENNVKWNPTKTFGIHSYSTYENYKQVSIQFIRYIRENHSDIKYIESISRKHAEEYLLQRQDQELSPYTISRDLSALNKLFNFKVQKTDIGLKPRSYKDVTRSRIDRPHDKKYNPENYKEQILFARATGSRRESILQVKPSDINYSSKGVPVSVHLKEKGGRERDATILKEYRNDIKEIANQKQSDQPMFEKYTDQIDNHAFRREYASARYNEIASEKNEVREDYRGLDKEILLQVSQDLGHNRADVSVYSYIR